MYKHAPTTRTLIAAVLACCAGTAAATPQPTAATDGVQFDSPSAGVTNITAPDNAIIDYSSFDVATGETVNFIQPGAAARVLNRINSSTPTQIDGMVNANGMVYFVNPAGVRFGAGSVVDAAGIFAAAGSMSDGDFLGGVNQFTGVTGEVANHGLLRADSIAALVGRSVINTGTITVPDGTAVLASGDSVLIGNPRGGVMVSVEASPNKAEGGIKQDGTVEAAQVSLVSGDIYSLAMTSEVQTANGGFRPDVTIEDIDTDGDGDIDFDDINTARANFTGPLPPGTGGKTQQEGDTDGDGDVDNTDIGTLVIFFTGPLTPPPSTPPDNPAEPFSLSALESVARLPEIPTEVNLTEADLGILRDQLGIAARPPLAQERIEKVQARGLYDDVRARANGAANDDGSLTIANTRLDADVVREALQVYREQLAVEGIEPAQRTAEIKQTLGDALQSYASEIPASEEFDADRFVDYVSQENPKLLAELGALERLRELTMRMGLSEAEKANSDRIIVDRARPDGLNYEQMKATLESAGSLSLAPVEPDAG